MPKPVIHAQRDVKQWGGVLEDYLPIHNLMDLSKGQIPTPVHRVLTHTTWFISNIIERVFGDYIINADGKKVSTRDIAEAHTLLDYRGKFIPTAQDFLQYIEIKPWMLNGLDGYPTSYQKCEDFTRANMKEVKISLDKVVFD